MEKNTKTQKIRLGFAITGSFCTHETILIEIEKLVQKGFAVYPIVSTATTQTNTRFGCADTFLETLEKICQNKVLSNIVEVEPTGPQNLFDIIVVAPCTGNTLAKIANGINDTPVTMAVKAHVRNDKPVVLGVSTNDAMGLNFKNIAYLFAAKNFYFIPFGQDNFAQKPKSLVADWSKLEDTIITAMQNKQIQPVLV